MKISLSAGVLALTLGGLAPATAQTPNVGQLLQGLTTGNQSQDQALRDAFERGYQKGRQDEAQFARSGRASRQDDSRGYNSQDRSQSPYGNQRGNTYNPR